MVDTGSPLTYLTHSALARLNLLPEQLIEFPALINGMSSPVFFSGAMRNIDNSLQESHFKHVNVLGMDFLSQAYAHFEIVSGTTHRYCKLICPNS